MNVILGGKLAGAAAGGRVVAVLAGQVAQLALVHMRQRGRGEEALGHVPKQAGRAAALAADAQSSAVVAHRLVVSVVWLGALGGGAVAGARPAALGLLLALLVVADRHKGAGIGQTAGALGRGALGLCPPGASLGTGVQRLIVLADKTRIAALVLALVLVKATVTLLAGLHNLVAAEGALRGLEAVSLRVAHQDIQHIGYIPDRAGRELGVVRSVSGCGTGEHDEVAI